MGHTEIIANDPTNPSTKSRTITYIIFFLLLISRFSINTFTFIDGTFSSARSIPGWLSWLEGVMPCVNTFYVFGVFLLIVIVILLNQEDLQKLNMDEFFIFIFICSGLATFIGYMFGLGCLAGIPAILFSIYALSKNNMKFGNTDPNSLRISLIAVGIFAGCFLIISGSLNILKIDQSIHLFFIDTLPDTVTEEVIYRGLLWMFLKDRGWSESRIIFFQAFLFWISHLNFLFNNPFNFWVFIPAVGLLLGYIVLRSKSITPSTITHLFINLLYGLILLSR